MAQLKWGARKTLDAIYTDLRHIIDLASDDPATVRELAQRVIYRIGDDIEPQMQRAAPALEQRVAALEDQMSELIERLTKDLSHV